MLTWIVGYLAVGMMFSGLLLLGWAHTRHKLDKAYDARTMLWHSLTYAGLWPLFVLVVLGNGDYRPLLRNNEPLVIPKLDDAYFAQCKKEERDKAVQLAREKQTKFANIGQCGHHLAYYGLRDNKAPTSAVFMFSAAEVLPLAQHKAASRTNPPCDEAYLFDYIEKRDDQLEYTAFTNIFNYFENLALELVKQGKGTAYCKQCDATYVSEKLTVAEHGLNVDEQGNTCETQTVNCPQHHMLMRISSMIFICFSLHSKKLDM